MQLVEKEKIDLKHTIRTYLPTYLGEVGDKVTIHHLLNHTSGIANIDTVTSLESALKSGVPL
jgi:CubicO group peptidase (beta-lactamase class C family)